MKNGIDLFERISPKDKKWLGLFEQLSPNDKWKPGSVNALGRAYES